MNRPRNVLIKDADPREAVVCEFQHSVGALRHSFVIHQTPAEPTWPGGALWDCGVLLSELLLAVAGIETVVLTSILLDCPQKKATRTTTQLKTRFQAWIQKSANSSVWASQVEEVLLHRPQLRIVELGCGVGLTGLVACVALGAATTILTDLTVVVDDVTQENVVENTQLPPGKKQSAYRTIRHFKGGGKVVAMPLCWGDVEQGQAVLKVLQELQPSSSTASTKGKKKKKAHQQSTTSTTSPYPDLILLGDVAYQHKPGAPSHFDILVESLLQLMPPNAPCNTLLLFGTRLRMPASMDLLLLLQEHFAPVLVEPIPAEVLDPALKGVKHNMTIHIFTNKRTTNGQE